MKKALFGALLALSLVNLITFSGCSGGFSLGGTTSVKKDFSNFTEVHVDGAFQINITQSNAFGITINADKKLLDFVVVTKEGNVLRIYLNPRHPFTDFTVLQKSFRADITMPALTSLRLSGDSRVSVTGFKLPQDNLDLQVAGSNILRLEDIETNTAKLDVSGNSQVSGSIKAVVANFDVAGSSKVALNGSANTTAINSSGTTNLNLITFPVGMADVKLSGVSEATLDIREKLDFDLVDASTLYFQGNPTIGTMKVSGASTIKHK